MTTHDFRGFAGDCTIMGQIELADGRLTDALNQANEVVVPRAVLTSLADDRALHFEELPVRRDELLLVGSDSPASEDQRRVPGSARGSCRSPVRAGRAVGPVRPARPLD